LFDEIEDGPDDDKDDDEADEIHLQPALRNGVEGKGSND
jgi:hypothetical protein